MSSIPLNATNTKAFPNRFEAYIIAKNIPEFLSIVSLSEFKVIKFP